MSTKFEELDAKSMFEELGYKCIVHKSYMFYYKTIEDLEDEYERNCEMNTIHLEFDFEHKEVNKTYGNDNSVYPINMQELKAINKQVEELGWLE